MTVSTDTGECQAGVDLLREEAPQGPGHREAPSGGSGRPSSRLERWLTGKLLRVAGNPPVTLELWDGVCACGGGAAGGPLVRIGDRRTLWKLVFQPDYEFAEAYVEGRVEVCGDLIELTRALFAAWRRRRPHPVEERLRLWAKFGSRSLSASRRNIHHHYDIGNEFYRLWLDRELLYTCAYFNRDDLSLEAAQVAKMEYVCRKLNLRPGERVIEAGCGWGALALYMAREYGVQVTAYNISQEQVFAARERARQEGLGDRVTFVEADWRQVTGECDAFVSVGMLEHVGPENYRKLGRVIDSCLAPHGRGLIHTIGLSRPRRIDSWTERRIFPGAQPPALSQMMKIFEPRDFDLLDIENLRRHYALTLRHWLHRFGQSEEVVRAMFDDRFVRMWRLYLASSVAAFETSWLQLFQVVFARPGHDDRPLTRRSLYFREEPSPDGPEGEPSS